jgi:hypothetical protein
VQRAGINLPKSSIQVKLVERDGELWAELVFGKSNLIYTLVKSDGMLITPDRYQWNTGRGSGRGQIVLGQRSNGY